MDQFSFLPDSPPPSPPTIVLNDGSFGFSTNGFGFNMSGTDGQAVVVEGSTNLLHWESLQTNVLGASPLYFNDPEARSLLQRSYRLRVLP